MNKIPIAGPSITQKEIDYVTEAVKTGWYEQSNAFRARFEQAMAERLGRRFALALPSCTSGLHLALASLGVGLGDEVIVPDVTWIASAAPVSYVGATPIFADIDPESWCLDASAFEACITPRTKAAIVVDLYGNMPDWAALEEVANRHKIALIEDSAEAIGARYRGRPAGSFGVVSTFSFHGTKTITTGEGGMLLTDDETLFQRCISLSDHGRLPGDIMFFNREVAFKYRMSGLQAALGLAQLERLDELIEYKRQTFRWYRDRLAGVNGLTLNSEAADVFNTYWMVTAVLDADLDISKETMISRLAKSGIDTRPFFYPLSVLPAYRDHPSSAGAHERNRVSHDIAWRGINLPSAYSVNEQAVDRVCRALISAMGEA
jgi:perosamine synthetase